jgi:hypothetical protein
MPAAGSLPMALLLQHVGPSVQTVRCRCRQHWSRQPMLPPPQRQITFFLLSLPAWLMAESIHRHPTAPKATIYH